MRIALDARTIQDHFPGIGRYTYNLALALADVAPRDELLVLHNSTQRNTRFDLSPLRAKTPIQIVETNARNFSLAEQWRISAWLRRARADVYHSPYYLMPFVTPCPAIVTVHDLIPLLYPQYFTAAQRIIFNVAIRLAVRATRHVVADSHATARDLQRLLRVPPAKITAIAAAADPQLVRPSPDVIAAMRARNQLPAEYALYLGSNKPHKNLVRLIEAYARVAQRNRIPLVIAGHWDASHPEAKRTAERLSLGAAIRWLGPAPQADLPALYAGATLFVFPSEYEGFGLPVLEAMACGTPVVCSSSSSLPEVTGDPATGSGHSAAILFNPRDTQDMADAIMRALSDEALQAQLATDGLRRAQQFTWDETARQVYALYARA